MQQAARMQRCFLVCPILFSQFLTITFLQPCQGLDPGTQGGQHIAQTGVTTSFCNIKALVLPIPNHFKGRFHCMSGQASLSHAGWRIWCSVLLQAILYFSLYPVPHVRVQVSSCWNCNQFPYPSVCQTRLTGSVQLLLAAVMHAVLLVPAVHACRVDIHRVVCTASSLDTSHSTWRAKTTWMLIIKTQSSLKP